MKEINKIIDVSVWTGHWPFMHLRYGDINVLEDKLKSIRVIKAFIAPIEAILEQDPTRANLALLQKVSGDFFSPVPVIDLSYANWDECMDTVLYDPRVKMIKLIPNYHQYKMYEKDMDALVEMTRQKEIVISIQMKVEDPRAQYPLMKVANVNNSDVLQTLFSYPEQIFILHCLTMDSVPGFMTSLDNVYLDIACIERQDTLSVLQKTYSSLDKFLFASHCPFYFPEGNINKLKYSDLDINEIDKVAYKNAEKLFGIM